MWLWIYTITNYHLSSRLASSNSSKLAAAAGTTRRKPEVVTTPLESNESNDEGIQSVDESGVINGK